MSTSVIIFLDVTPKTFIGINTSSFNSSPQFVGINNIPTGLHFIYTGTDASLSIRNGHWVAIKAIQDDETAIVVLRWSAINESLERLDNQSKAVQNITRSLRDLVKRGLVDYEALETATSKLKTEQSSASTSQSRDTDTDVDPWPRLKSHISPGLLNRILSNTKDNADVSNSDRSTWTLTSISSASMDTEKIPGLSEDESRSVLSSNETLNLLPIDLKQTWPDSAVGRERTDKARDRSWYLNHLLETISSNPTSGSVTDKQVAAREILGELQFCFIMVLTLANYSCLEQWKRILTVLLTCEAALREVQGYFVEAVKVLQEQLNRVADVEGGLFEMSDEQGSAWLRRLLRTFRRNVDEALDGSREGSELKDILKNLESWLRETYGWEDQENVLRRGMMQLEDGEMVEMQMDGYDEEDETGEYAPVIVET